MTFPCSSGTHADLGLKAGLNSSLCCVSGAPDCQGDAGFSGHCRLSGEPLLDAVRVQTKKTGSLKKSPF